MALIPCRECQTIVSDQAETCPRCGIDWPGWEPGLTVCYQCRRLISEEAQACPYCGNSPAWQPYAPEVIIHLEEEKGCLGRVIDFIWFIVVAVVIFFVVVYFLYS